MRNICKYIMIIFIFNFFYSTFLLGKISLDLRLGYNMGNLENFSYSYENIFKNGFDIPVNATKLNGMFLKGVNIRYFFLDNLSLNLKDEFMVIENEDILHDSSLDKDTISSKVILYIMYIGIGPRYYLSFDNLKNLNIYLGIDAGMFFNLYSFWEVKFLDKDPYYYNSSYEYQKIDFQNSFFAFNVETGFEWKFTKTIGTGLTIGYKFAKYEGEDKKEGIFKKENLYFDTIDFSGGYATVELIFYFGKEENKNINYEKKGDYYYKHKNYKQALFYYLNALKNNYTKYIYIKIGLCYYYLKNKAKAKEFFIKHLEIFPGDIKTKRWLKALN